MARETLLLILLAAVGCAIAAVLFLAVVLAIDTLAQALMGLLRQLYGEEHIMGEHPPERDLGSNAVPPRIVLRKPRQETSCNLIARNSPGKTLPGPSAGGKGLKRTLPSRI